MNDLFYQLVMDNKKSRAENDDSNDIFQMLIQTQKKHGESSLNKILIHKSAPIANTHYSRFLGFIPDGSRGVVLSGSYRNYRINIDVCVV